MYTTLGLIIAIVLFVLIVIRLALPPLVLYYTNRFLRNHATLHGAVGKVNMSLRTGRFTFEHIRIGMTDETSGIDNLVVQIPEVDITVKLTKLMRKKVFAHITLFHPEVVFANVLNKADEPREKKEQKHKQGQERLEQKVFVKSPVKQAFEKMLPFKIDLDIISGNLRYIDSSSKPQRDIALEKLALSVRNLSNMSNQTEPALISANAILYGGDLNVNLVLQPLEEYLTFDLKMELADAELVQLNDYFRQYANIDAHAGSLNVYTEIIAVDGSFKGYLKPVFKNIDIIGSEDGNDSIFKKVWERIVATVIQALENNKVDELTTRIEIEGQLTDPHLNILAAISGTLKDAFIRAIQSSLQEALSISSILRSAIRGTSVLVKKMFA